MCWFLFGWVGRLDEVLGCDESLGVGGDGVGRVVRAALSRLHRSCRRRYVVRRRRTPLFHPCFKYIHHRQLFINTQYTMIVQCLEKQRTSYEMAFRRRFATKSIKAIRRGHASRCYAPFKLADLPCLAADLGLSPLPLLPLDGGRYTVSAGGRLPPPPYTFRSCFSRLALREGHTSSF